MIQLRKSEVIIDPEQVALLKAEFEQNHFIRLPKLLEPALLDFISAQMEKGQWCDMTHQGIGSEVILADPLPLDLLHMLINHPAFLDMIREITNCRDITWFGGRVYRFVPGSDHHDSWHSDNTDQRLVALSLNLSTRAYQGGVFKLRDRKFRRVLLEAENTGWGDAIVFRILKDFDHRITNVTGSEPKTAFAGWFQAGQPDFITRLRKHYKVTISHHK